MSKPKVIHITSWYPNQTDPQLGVFIEKHIVQTYTFADNIVLAIIPSLEMREIRVTEEFKGNTKIIVGYYPARYGKYFRNYRNYTSCLSKMLNIFLEYNTAPDLIHCHVADKSVRIAAKVFRNTPYIVTEHWSGYLNGAYEEMSTSKQKKRIYELNKAQHIHTVSPALRDKFRKLEVKTPITLIDNVIEVTHLKAQTNKELQFLIVADLIDSVKNISGVLRAFAIQLELHPSHTLHIIGGGKDVKMLEALTKELKLDESVQFMGRLPNSEVLDTYSQHDVLIVNSRTETYSMVTAEALACGLPVISSRCGGPEQFVQEGINGLLVDVDNDTQLALSMDEMSKTISKYTPDLVRASVADRFSIQQIENTHKQVVSEVLVNK
jgi:glycosyltransferase involved in cell wall biosynthesis